MLFSEHVKTRWKMQSSLQLQTAGRSVQASAWYVLFCCCIFDVYHLVIKYEHFMILQKMVSLWILFFLEVGGRTFPSKLRSEEGLRAVVTSRFCGLLASFSIYWLFTVQLIIPRALTGRTCIINSPLSNLIYPHVSALHCNTALTAFMAWIGVFVFDCCHVQTSS